MNIGVRRGFDAIPVAFEATTVAIERTSHVVQNTTGGVVVIANSFNLITITVVSLVIH